MTTPDPTVWLTWQETHVQPRYFTGPAWATLGHQQRDMIRRQRMAVVEHLRADHEARYHHGDRRADELAGELDVFNNYGQRG